MNPSPPASEEAPPLVSIGMPVYNAEKTIASGLAALLSQTHRRIELIISDNASSDRTAEICAGIAAGDRRVRYLRQERNIGAARNFAFVLDEARGRFFMWAAHDDRWGRGFIAENLAFLEGHPDYVGSMSRSHCEGFSPSSFACGTRRLDHPWRSLNLYRFAVWPGANARFYSLFRTSALRGIDIAQLSRIAGDWSVMADIIARGKLNTLRGPVQFIKGFGGASASPAHFRAARTMPFEAVVPLFHFARTISRHRVLLPCAPSMLLNSSLFALAYGRWWLRSLFGRGRSQ